MLVNYFVCGLPEFIVLLVGLPGISVVRIRCAFMDWLLRLCDGNLGFSFSLSSFTVFCFVMFR